MHSSSCCGYVATHGTFKGQRNGVSFCIPIPFLFLFCVAGMEMEGRWHGDGMEGTGMERELSGNGTGTEWE
jgi:hypothetical protein